MAEASDRDLGVQNDFFNLARKSRSRITILLNSGKRLAGRIKSFDRYTLILDSGGGGEEMVFKHAIATISLEAGPSTRPGAASTARRQRRAPRRANRSRRWRSSKPRPSRARETVGRLSSAL